MNFDTKHLVRWGIPGWILIMIIGPYFYFVFQNDINEIAKTINLLALGAFLTVIGVPLGYLLNQVHHSLFWVMRKLVISRKILKQEKWYQYFSEEIQLDKLFFKDENGRLKKERYQYLLSRKHELGGVTVSLLISCLVILFVNIKKSITIWSWWYLSFVFILFVIIFISRWYSSKNIDKYFKEYLKESKKL
jgi:O-antigen/teichoic acid export membrane protein